MTLVWATCDHPDCIWCRTHYAQPLHLFPDPAGDWLFREARDRELWIAGIKERLGLITCEEGA